MVKSRLRQLREELSNPKVSQEAIARKVGISLQWYRLIESGSNTSWTTANAILRAVNVERGARDLAVLSLEELELKIV